MRLRLKVRFSTENPISNNHCMFVDYLEVARKRKSVVPPKVLNSFESELQVLDGYEEVAELTNSSIDMSQGVVHRY